MLWRCFDYRKINKFWFEDGYAPVSSNIIYLMEDDIGMWSFQFLSKDKSEGYSIGAYMGPDCRGKKAFKSMLNSFKWIFSNTDIKRIFADIPRDRRKSCLIASRLMMEIPSKINGNRKFEVIQNA